MAVELADTSAWTNRRKDPETSAAFEAQLLSGEIATCPMVKLELLWESRDRDTFTARRRRLDMLREVPIGERVWRRALDVLQLSAEPGPLHHRQLPIRDLLIAAAAERAELTLCHYDHDFELIAQITGQPVRAIAPLGSL